MIAVPDVERRTRRNVEQLRVFVPALDLGVDVGERRAFAEAVRQYDDAGRRIWRRFYKD